MKINRFKTAILGLSSLAIASGFARCDLNYQPLRAEQVPKQITTDYFQRFINVSENSNPVIILGDYDGDGDTDFLVPITQYCKDNGPEYGYNTNLYFFENDGKGNFELRPKTETKYEGEQK